MVGLGDIARKAYLPVLATRPDVELHLVTRDAGVLAELGERWRIAGRHADMASALATTCFDAAFIHAATSAHPTLVAQALEAGLGVLVDKPLADNLSEAARLVEIAKGARVPLMVGFNRRYAPAYAALRDRPRSLVQMTKNRKRLLHPARRTVFDDFIHVVDTLRFLAPVPVEVAGVETVMRDGLLEAVLLTLRSFGAGASLDAGFRATGAMHRNAGLDREQVDAMGGGSTLSVRDMADVVDEDGAECRVRRGDWTSVERQRGFTGLCDAFLDAIRSGATMAMDDMLETHRICEAIVFQAEDQDACY